MTTQIAAPVAGATPYARRTPCVIATINFVTVSSANGPGLRMLQVTSGSGEMRTLSLFCDGVEGWRRIADYIAGLDRFQDGDLVLVDGPTRHYMRLARPEGIATFSNMPLEAQP